MTISSTTTTATGTGNGSTHSYAYGFKIFADADLEVIIRTTATGTETVKTLNTHYVVTNAGSDSGGNVLFKYNTGNNSDAHYSASEHRPASGETVLIRRKLTLTQGTDYVANDPFPADSHENALDRLTFISQQQQEEIDRCLKLSRTNTMTSPEFTTSATDRASKLLAFDSSGELSVTQELGTYKGTSPTTTTAAFVQRDIVKGSTTAQLNNVYICVADSVIGDSLTDTDHFALLVDAVTAATSATAAASSATAAASSASSASSSASTASTQASNASTSASTASTQATNASNSATAAASSATSAAAALDSFDDIFLGAKSSDPTVDNDGDALTAGDLYFNTSSNVLKVYNGSAWQTVSTFTTGISNGNIAVFTSGVADNDFLKVDGTSIEGRSASEVLSDIGASAVAGSSSIVTTGAIDSGSITSGFGSIDIGSSSLSTTGSVTLGATSFGDNNITNVGSIALDSIASDAGTGTAITFSAANVPNTQTAGSQSGNITPDFSQFTNFILTLTGNIVLQDPGDEVAGQSGIFVFIQDGTGSRTLSHADDRYFVAGGTSITLSTGANAIDIVPYFVQADGKIHLGAAQKAFAEA
mgnify:CR=1 FL=1